MPFSYQVTEILILLAANERHGIMANVRWIVSEDPV